MHAAVGERECEREREPSGHNDTQHTKLQCAFHTMKRGGGGGASVPWTNGRNRHTTNHHNRPVVMRSLNEHKRGTRALALQMLAQRNVYTYAWHTHSSIVLRLLHVRIRTMYAISKSSAMVLVVVSLSVRLSFLCVHSSANSLCYLVSINPHEHTRTIHTLHLYAYTNNSYVYISPKATNTNCTIYCVCVKHKYWGA